MMFVVKFLIYVMKSFLWDHVNDVLLVSNPLQIRHYLVKETRTAEVTYYGEDIHFCRDGGSDVCLDHEWWSRLSLDGGTSREQAWADQTRQASNEDETRSATRTGWKECCCIIVQYRIRFNRIFLGTIEMTSSPRDAVSFWPSQIMCSIWCVEQRCGWSADGRKLFLHFLV